MNPLRVIACIVLLASCFSGVQRAEANSSECNVAPCYRAEVINPNLSGGLRLPRSETVLVWGTDGAIWRSETLGEWSRTQTHTDADLSKIAANRDGSVLIAVGQRGTILRSIDQGRRWSTMPTSLGDQDLRTVVHHAMGDVWLAVGTGASILRSLDQGRSWIAVGSDLRLTFETLASDATNNLLLIGGEDGVVGVSRDRGESWQLTRIDMPGERTPISAFHRLDDDLIVATSAYGRVLVSDDHGESWIVRETRARGFFTSGAVERNGTLWLATHTGELWRSTHQARHFERVRLGLRRTDRYISAVHIDSNNTIIAGHGGLLVRGSIDVGWQEVAHPPANLESIITAAGDRYVAIGEGGLIMESVDAGANWRTVNLALRYTMREALAIPRTDTFISVGALGAVLRSVDAGATWQSVEVHYPNINTPPTLRALHLEPLSGALLAAGPPGTIMRSSDAGMTWSLKHWTPLEAEEAFPWLLAMTDTPNVFAIEARGASYLSSDGGLSWTRRALNTQREFWHGATLRGRDVSVIAGQRGVAAVSRNSGSSWSFVDTHVDADLYGSFADERGSALFLFGSQGTLLRSADLGQTWQCLALPTTSALRRMLRTPDDEALLVFGADGAILRSPNGRDWQQVHSGTPSELRKGLIDLRTRSIVLIGQHGTTLLSGDQGMTWRPLQTNTRRDFRGAAVDHRGNIVAVGERIVRLVRTDALGVETPRVSRVE